MTDPPRRVHFFDGRMITAEDLSAEQAYHREMRHLHNRLHGYGVVSGLIVAEADEDIQVSPGVAIDGLGRELILTEPQRVPLGWGVPTLEFEIWFLSGARTSTAKSPVPTARRWPRGWSSAHASRWLAPTNLRKGRVLLARLSPTHGGVAIDLEVRRHIAPDRRL